MEELVTKYHPEKYSSIKTIEGILFAVKCFGGEMPFFFLSSMLRITNLLIYNAILFYSTI
jgi:hypothetical protein